MFVPGSCNSPPDPLEALRGILQGMLTSEDGDAREAAAQTIVVASFRVKIAFEDLQLSGAPGTLRAAWQRCCGKPPFSAKRDPRCREWLKEAFNDPSIKVLMLQDVAPIAFKRPALRRRRTD